MIEVRECCIGRRTGRGAQWEAVAEVGGRRFRALSRSGAVNALARELVAAGVADGPLVVRTQGLPGTARCGSFYGLARWTYSEGSGSSLYRVRWKPRPGLDADEQE